jgi:hypothetical protein
MTVSSITICLILPLRFMLFGVLIAFISPRFDVYKSHSPEVYYYSIMDSKPTSVKYDQKIRQKGDEEV